MDRRTCPSRPLGHSGVLAILVAVVMAAGSTPASVIGAGATAVVGPAAVALAPGLRAELIVGGPAPVDAASVRTSVAVALGALGATTSSPRAASEATPPRTPTTARPTARPTKAAPSQRTFRGSNRVWSAALGLDRSVSWFSCSRSRPPDMALYRWGCAGQNNVYLFAHAGGPFKRLHDLYVRGGLRRGMTVTYADAHGQVHQYRVAWWRVVLPTNGDFAFAAQPRPSMTLQTCVGLHDRYRLVVRLYQSA